jgi:hypothetical protein
MSKLSFISQMVIDLWLQDYSSDETFIQTAHVNFLIGSFYNTLLVADYQKSKAENQAENGMIYPSFAQEVMTLKDFETKVDESFKYCEIPNVVSFPYDQNSYGIVGVRCVKNKVCGEFTRSKASMKRMFCNENGKSTIPFTSTIWFWLESNRLYFYSAKEIPDKVTVTFIPTVDANDEEFIIPQSYEQQIITGVLQLLKGAAQGTIIDESNNSNPNKTIGTELDPSQLKAKQ